MSGIVSVPPAILLNPRTARLHVESCAVVKAHPGDVDAIFTNWTCRDVAIAIHGRDLLPCRGCKPLSTLARWEQKHKVADELAVLVEAVESRRYTLLDEDTLQESLVAVLGATREVNLSLGGRIDLLVGRIGVEVKVAGTTDALMRQVQRYTRSPEIAGVLVVSTVIAHAILPRIVAGKPVRTAYARGGI